MASVTHIQVHSHTYSLSHTYTLLICTIKYVNGMSEDTTPSGYTTFQMKLLRQRDHGDSPGTVLPITTTVAEVDCVVECR